LTETRSAVAAVPLRVPMAWADAPTVSAAADAGRPLLVMVVVVPMAKALE